ncbi:hypothetical protein [Paenibacillus thermotolerans]|uniref:hypothetical protein n=1 Tax=Paenibacillus thermotolerans TaxID=3027807 RepID=UPI002368726F|nr:MULTISPECIES: hypothetical protein [unclassified Paenibacillus]
MGKKCKVYVSLLLTAALLIPQAGVAPTAQAAAVGVTVVANDFDTGTDGWFKRGSETVNIL